MGKIKIICVVGATASGKTDLAVKLAKAVNGEIISADSMQVYKHMDIGTAKITSEEMQGVPHYLIDILEPSEDFNVVTFKNLASEKVKEIESRDKIPIVVGGTGFYIQALLYDIDFTDNDNDMSYRTELEAIAKEKGNSVLYDMLKSLDGEAAAEIHPNNVKRVIRALEFYKKSNQKISEHNKTERQKKSPYDAKYFALTDEREKIYENIEKRIDKMLEMGLVTEVKALIETGISRTGTAMQGLGYKEIAAYLNGEMSFEEAIYVLKRDTRHFAKRQLTWLRREKDVIWFDKSEISEDQILNDMITEITKEKGDTND